MYRQTILGPHLLAYVHLSVWTSHWFWELAASSSMSVVARKCKVWLVLSSGATFVIFPVRKFPLETPLDAYGMPLCLEVTKTVVMGS